MIVILNTGTTNHQPTNRRSFVCVVFQVQNARHASDPSVTSTMIDLSSFPVLAANVSFLSLWGVCANNCANYNYFSIRPTNLNYNAGIAQTKYTCSCTSAIALNCDGNRYTAKNCDESTFYGEDWNLATPSFDCLDPTSGRMGGRVSFMIFWNTCR